MTDIPLFDCSPKIAAKLARCEEIARAQRCRSATPWLNQRGDKEWTSEDWLIFANARLGVRQTITGSDWTYYETLNA